MPMNCQVFDGFVEVQTNDRIEINQYKHTITENLLIVCQPPALILPAPVKQELERCTLGLVGKVSSEIVYQFISN